MHKAAAATATLILILTLIPAANALTKVWGPLAPSIVGISQEGYIDSHNYTHWAFHAEGGATDYNVHVWQNETGWFNQTIPGDYEAGLAGYNNGTDVLMIVSWDYVNRTIYTYGTDPTWIGPATNPIGGMKSCWSNDGVDEIMAQRREMYWNLTDDDVFYTFQPPPGTNNYTGFGDSNDLTGGDRSEWYAHSRYSDNEIYSYYWNGTGWSVGTKKATGPSITDKGAGGANVNSPYDRNYDIVVLNETQYHDYGAAIVYTNTSDDLKIAFFNLTNHKWTTFTLNSSINWLYPRIDVDKNGSINIIAEEAHTYFWHINGSTAQQVITNTTTWQFNRLNDTQGCQLDDTKRENAYFMIDKENNKAHLTYHNSTQAFYYRGWSLGGPAAPPGPDTCTLNVSSPPNQTCQCETNGTIGWTVTTNCTDNTANWTVWRNGTKMDSGTGWPMNQSDPFLSLVECRGETGISGDVMFYNESDHVSMNWSLLGDGFESYMFVSFPTAWLEGKQVRTYVQAYGSAETRVRIYDGYFNRTHPGDFPPILHPLTSKGAGLVQNIKLCHNTGGVEPCWPDKIGVPVDYPAKWVNFTVNTSQATLPNVTIGFRLYVLPNHVPPMIGNLSVYYFAITDDAGHEYWKADIGQNNTFTWPEGNRGAANREYGKMSATESTDIYTGTAYNCTQPNATWNWTIMVEDVHGNNATDTVWIKSIPNNPPTVHNWTGDITIPGGIGATTNWSICDCDYGWGHNGQWILYVNETVNQTGTWSTSNGGASCFENQTPGQPATSWSNSSTSYIRVNDTTTYGGTRSGEYIPQGVIGFVNHEFYTIDTDNTHAIEFAIKRIQGAPTVFILESTSGSDSIYLRYHTNLYYRTSAGLVDTGYALNQVDWYYTRIYDINFTSQTYSIDINGTKFSTLPFKDGALAQNITNISMANFNLKKFLIDDICITDQIQIDHSSWQVGNTYNLTMFANDTCSYNGGYNDTATIWLTLTNTPPNITGPGNLTVHCTKLTDQVNWTVTDIDHNNGNYWIHINNSLNQTGTWTNNTLIPWSIQFNTTGRWNVSFTATDGVDNVTNWSWITIWNHCPTVWNWTGNFYVPGWGTGGQANFSVTNADLGHNESGNWWLLVNDTTNQTGTWETRWGSTFNNQTLGTKATGWINNTDTFYVNVSDRHLYRTYGGNPAARSGQIISTAGAGSLTYNINGLWNTDNETEFIAAIYPISGSLTVTLYGPGDYTAAIVFDSHQAIKTYSPTGYTTLQTWNPNNWYHLRVYNIDFTAQTYEIQINQSLHGTQPFANNTAIGITQVRLINDGPSDYQIDDLYLTTQLTPTGGFDVSSWSGTFNLTLVANDTCGCLHSATIWVTAPGPVSFVITDAHCPNIPAPYTPPTYELRNGYLYNTSYDIPAAYSILEWRIAFWQDAARTTPHDAGNYTNLTADGLLHVQWMLWINATYGDTYPYLEYWTGATWSNATDTIDGRFRGEHYHTWVNGNYQIWQTDEYLQCDYKATDLILRPAGGKCYLNLTPTTPAGELWLELRDSAGDLQDSQQITSDLLQNAAGDYTFTGYGDPAPYIQHTTKKWGNGYRYSPDTYNASLTAYYPNRTGWNTSYASWNSDKGWRRQLSSDTWRFHQPNLTVSYTGTTKPGVTNRQQTWLIWIKNKDLHEEYKDYDAVRLVFNSTTGRSFATGSARLSDIAAESWMHQARVPVKASNLDEGGQWTIQVYLVQYNTGSLPGGTQIDTQTITLEDGVAGGTFSQIGEALGFEHNLIKWAFITLTSLAVAGVAIALGVQITVIPILILLLFIAFLVLGWVSVWITIIVGIVTIVGEGLIQ